MFFSWLRRKVKEAVLGGVADALTTLDDDPGETADFVRQLRGEGESPALAHDGNGRARAGKAGAR